MEIASIDELIGYLKTRKPFLRERFGVTRIGVFGSFARGDHSAQSDIDLIVEIENTKKNIHTFFQLRRLLEQELSRQVDLGFEDSLKPIVRERVKGNIIYA